MRNALLLLLLLTACGGIQQVACFLPAPPPRSAFPSSSRRAAWGEADSDGDSRSLEQLTVVKLKNILRERGLPVSGRKEELLERLLSLEEQRKEDVQVDVQERDRPFGEKNEMYRYFATCARGLEGVLKSELASPQIGASDIKGSGRGVSFGGDAGVGYRAVLWLRTALRVMVLVAESTSVQDRQALYDLTSTVDWASFMAPDDTLSVDATNAGAPPEDLSHSHFSALTVKNAVVDKFRESHGIRPSVDTQNAAMPLIVHLEGGGAKLYRALSGCESLHKRGYRRVMHAASLKETTAAGLLLNTGWDPSSQVLVDPMCGSGTLAIEACLIAMRVAPGLVALGYQGTGCTQGSYMYPFHKWLDFDSAAWDDAVQEARDLVLPAPPRAIFANDWHEGALSLAYDDAEAAGVHKFIQFFNEDAREFAPSEEVDLVVCNPPWDMRLRDAEESWDSLLSFLRQRSRDAWILSGNPDMQSFLRLRAERYLALAQGGAQLRWLHYIIHQADGPEGGRSSARQNYYGGQGRRSRRSSQERSTASRRARW